MGELIYCKHPIAANPLYLEGASHNIYSLEELSYYVRENPYLITPEFMSQELCDWIRDELLDEELADQLEKCLSENVPLHLFVSRVLMGCGYLTRTEIRVIIDIIEGVESLSDDERKKVHADQLLSANRIIDAIYEYDSILSKGEGIDEDLAADICHNEGTAYAWLYFFEEASMCYERAFILGKRIESLRGMLLSAAMMEDDARLLLLFEKYRIPADKAEEIKEEISRMKQAPEVSEFATKLTRLRGDYSDQSAYMEQLLYIISGFTDEYKKVSKI